MSDQAPVTPDTPQSNPSTDTPEIPWQKRYEDLRPEFDRTTQELAQERGVWEDEQTALTRLQERFPHLFEDDTEDEEDTSSEDFDDPRDAKIAELEARVARFEPWQQDVETERGERRFNQDLKAVAGDRELTDRQRDWIKGRTAVLGNNKQALEKAFADFSELEKELTGAHLEQVTKSKQTQHTAPGGKPGTQVPTLDTHEDRRAFYKQRLAERGMT